MGIYLRRKICLGEFGLEFCFEWLYFELWFNFCLWFMMLQQVLLLGFGLVFFFCVLMLAWKCLCELFMLAPILVSLDLVSMVMVMQMI